MTALATLITCFVIGLLLVLNHDPRLRTTPALWLPVIWVAIATSRPVSVWLQMAPPERSIENYLEGSPLDRNVFSVLLAMGLAVLISRGRKVVPLLRLNRLLVLFFAYCAFSIAWSDFPDVTFKRLVKALGDVVMILVILTEPDPTAAIKRLFERVAFVFVPLSLLFIRFYGDLGRQYSRWEGTVSYSGIAVDKNMLGMACLIFGIVLSWRLLQEMSAPRSYQSDRTFLVHGVVLAMLIALLAICNSMTALGCFIMASGLILAMTFPGFARRRALVHFMVVAIVCTVIVTLFVDIGGLLLQQLGRNPTLTGRTELWADLPAFGASPLFGTGFESFWLGPRLDKIWALHWWRPNQAHNGYLEAYLNLGAVGVGLLALVAIRGYRRISAMIGYDPVGAQLRLAFFVVAVAYNFTEAAFRAQHPVWLTFLIAIIAVPRPQPHGAAERGDTKASAKRRPALAGAYRRQGRSKPLQRPSAT